MLLEPFQLGDLALKNRMPLAPMTLARVGVGRLPTVIKLEDDMIHTPNGKESYEPSRVLETDADYPAYQAA